MAQQRIGRYQVLEDIASGGQGSVHRAFDPETGQIVALKVLHPHLGGDSAFLERVHREAQLAASIEHPNVIRIFEVGQGASASSLKPLSSDSLGNVRPINLEESNKMDEKPVSPVSIRPA